MERITAIEPPGSGVATDRVRLDHDRRSRRRMVIDTAGGRRLLLDEQRPVHLRYGAVLRLADGTGVLVEAEPEDLHEIHAHSSAELVRIAWHLGNRHLPTQLLPGQDGGTIRIRHDHVIAAMVEGLGGHVHAISAAFDPEGGAYAEGTGGHHHGHHDHGHAHAHAQAHDHAHG